MEQIGRYQIVGELGRGAMGVVFRALDPSIGREVAIKTIRLSEFNDAEQRSKQRERLFREARSAGILSHPNIITIYDMAEQDDVAYIAMEFVAGSSLEQILSSRDSIPPERIFSILRDTAAGLDYAHHKGIIHRDIKPANIILTESGAAKIADFGIAKISAAEQLTQTGLIVGTPNYMAPEQVQGKPVGGPADQYSLAVLAYEMLTGDKPFVADQLTTLVYQIVCEPPPPAQRLNPTLGDRIEAVLQKGLSKQPDQRYETCSALVEALEAACGATPGWKSLARGAGLNLPTMGEIPTPPAPPVRTLPPPRGRPEQVHKKSRAVPIFITLVIGIATGAAVYYAGQPVETQVESVPEPKKQEPVEQSASRPPEPVEAQPARKGEAPAPIAAAPDPAPTRIHTSVEVPVRSEPPGATATLDGLAGTACVTPCVLKASLGDHMITLNLEGYKTTVRPIKVKDGPVDLPILTMAPAAGILMVQTQPEGATITVDDRKWPKPSPTQISLAPGNYRIVVEKGDLKAAQNVEIRDGDLKHLSISLSQQ